MACGDATVGASPDFHRGRLQREKQRRENMRRAQLLVLLLAETADDD